MGKYLWPISHSSIILARKTKLPASLSDGHSEELQNQNCEKISILGSGERKPVFWIVASLSMLYHYMVHSTWHGTSTRNEIYSADHTIKISPFMYTTLTYKKKKKEVGIFFQPWFCNLIKSWKHYFSVVLLFPCLVNNHYLFMHP